MRRKLNLFASLELGSLRVNIYLSFMLMLNVVLKRTLLQEQIIEVVSLFDEFFFVSLFFLFRQFI